MKLKKAKLKIKKLFKTAILDESKSPQYNQKSEPKQCKSKVEEIFTKTWKVAVTESVYLKLNRGFHARKNLKEHYPKVVTFSDASFIKKGIYVYDYNLDNIYIH